MYSRRATLLTFTSLRNLLKVCRTSSPCVEDVKVIPFARNFKTATERSDFYNDNYVNGNENGYANRLSGGTSDGFNRESFGSPQNAKVIPLATERSDFYNGNYVNGDEHGYANRFSGGTSDGFNRESFGSPKNVKVIPFATERSDFYNGNYVNSDEHGYANRFSGGTSDGSNAGSFGSSQQNQIGGKFAQGSTYGMSGGGSDSMNGQYWQNPDGLYGNQYQTPKQNDGFSYPNAKNWNDTPNKVMDVTQVSNNIKQDEILVERPTLEMLDEFCRTGKLKEAVELLRSLEQQHVPVDLPWYVSLMEACGENKALDEARSVHEHLIRSIPHLEVRIYNRILEMYCKCGSMHDAFVVFDKMPQRNLTSWETMITWLAKNGLGEASLELFSEFKRSGLQPDAQMFIGVFSVCGIVGDIVEGVLHFESMSKDYGISPSMEHYVSGVAMFGSAGCLEEALEFIQQMPIEPGVEIWETLMKFCRIHGDSVLGDHCAQRVDLLDPSRLNEHSKAGLIPIQPSANIRETRKSNGQNPLEVKGAMSCRYKAGDRSTPYHESIYALLSGLQEQMKDLGYVADTRFVLHDVDPETKEEALMGHSERLAAAHAFLTTPARFSFRIMKNLRVCGDCHVALKLISKIVGRQIIARDAKRFHHFENGVCSCKDYW